MGPPAKDTPEYEEYKVKQNHKKLLQRRAQQLLKRRALARPFVASALRAARKEHDAKLQDVNVRKNKLTRENNTLMRTKTILLTHNIELGKQVERLAAQVKQMKQEKEDITALQSVVKKLKMRISSWELWYSRVTSKATWGFLRSLKRLGKPPPPARDRCWGGGQ